MGTNHVTDKSVKAFFDQFFIFLSEYLHLKKFFEKYSQVLIFKKCF